MFTLRSIHLAASLLCIVSALSAAGDQIVDQVVDPAAAVTGANVDALRYDVTLHVAQKHDRATDDANPGTNPARPLRTLAAAFKLTSEHLQADRGVRVLVGEGVYREGDLALRCINWPEDRRDAPFRIEGVGPGPVVIKGSDDWSTGWTQHPEHSDVYFKAWPHKWGLAENPWYQRFGIVIEAVGLRREIVWLNGRRLRQVQLEKYTWHDPDGHHRHRTDDDGKADNHPGEWKYEGLQPLTTLEPGTFGVTEREENDKRLYIRLPEGVSLDGATVEVGMRGELMRVGHRNNVVVRNLTFMHANGSVGEGPTAVVFQCNNLLIEDCRFTENNARPMTFGNECRDITIRRVTSNDNGWQGFSCARPDNLLIVDCVTNGNNWRGEWGNQHGCDAAAVKIMGPAGGVGVRVLRHTAINNRTHGLWFDHCEAENAPITIEDSIFANNHEGAQVYLEKLPGPILVRNCIMWNRTGLNALRVIAHRVTLVDNILFSETGKYGAVRVSRRTVSPYRSNRDWVMRGNTFITLGDHVLFDRGFTSDEQHNGFLDTITASGNRYWNPDRKDIFTGREKDRERARLTLEGWQELTGQDKDSVFEAPPFKLDAPPIR